MMTGTKEIHAVNYIWMRLAHGLTEGVIRTSKYKINWEFVNKSELKGLYTRVMGYLTEGKFGEYFAVKEIFGKEVADRLAKDGDVVSPG